MGCDCNNGVENGNTGCGPCGTCPVNSADAETLPSTLDNFTQQFFGTITKTEVNGQVTWTLPCNLDTGLPGNPRGSAEGLACYFLRLFSDGIVGLIGPQGDTGLAGNDGNNAYTVVTTAFNAPTVPSPTVQFNVIPSPAISAGQTMVAMWEHAVPIGAKIFRFYFSIGRLKALLHAHPGVLRVGGT